MFIREIARGNLAIAAAGDFMGFAF